MEHAKFSELEPYLPEVEEKMATLICNCLEVPRDRLKKLKLYDGEALEEGRTGMDIHFEPELSDLEEKKLRLVCQAFSAFHGGRPPMFLEKA